MTSTTIDLPVARVRVPQIALWLALLLPPVGAAIGIGTAVFLFDAIDPLTGDYGLWVMAQMAIIFVAAALIGSAALLGARGDAPVWAALLGTGAGFVVVSVDYLLYGNEMLSQPGFFAAFPGLLAASIVLAIAGGLRVRNPRPTSTSSV